MVELKQIDESNFIDSFHLELGEGQEEYVSHPIRSLAQAYVYREQCTPFGIYAGEKMVGYVMVIYDYDEEGYNIWHMMIDKAQQHRGYGREALERVLDYIRSKPFGQSGSVSLTCHRENAPALSLYRSLGFRETGRDFDEEIELGIELG